MVSSPLKLRQTIWNEIVTPCLEEQNVKKKAQELNLGEKLSQQEATNLYDHIHSDVIGRIAIFMRSEKAQSICKNVSLYEPRSSFSNDVGTFLESQILKIYDVNLFSRCVSPSQEKPLTSWIWSLLGY